MVALNQKGIYITLLYVLLRSTFSSYIILFYVPISQVEKAMETVASLPLDWMPVTWQVTMPLLVYLGHRRRLQSLPKIAVLHPDVWW